MHDFEHPHMNNSASPCPRHADTNRRSFLARFGAMLSGPALASCGGGSASGQPTTETPAAGGAPAPTPAPAPAPAPPPPSPAPAPAPPPAPPPAAPAPSPGLATISGSRSGFAGTPVAVVIRLDAPADKPYTVSAVCSGGTVSPATSTIASGDTSSLFSVVRASSGTCSVSFSTSPALPTAGSPFAIAFNARAAGPTITLLADSSGTAAFTFGQCFRAGDVPSGQQVSTGDPATDTVVLNRWPDGSVKFALVSGIKSFVSGTPIVINLLAGPVTANVGPAVGTADLTKTAATASIGFGSATATWDASDWSSPFRQVSSGQQMSSWQYRKPLGGDAHLVAWLEVRCYKNGAVEVLPWIENGYLSVANPQVKSGRATFTLGGVKRYDSMDDAGTRGNYTLDPVISATGVLSIQHHSRHVLVRGGVFSHWLDQSPKVTVWHDRPYLVDSRCVPDYHGTGLIEESALAALTARYNPGRVCYTNAGMGGTGYSPDIGLLPNAAALYLASGDPRAFAATISCGMSLGNYSIHFRDQSTNRPLLFASHPTASASSVAVDNVYSAVYASSHHPAAAYLPYLLTGWNWFAEEMQFQTTDHYLIRNPSYRKNASFYFYPSAWAPMHNDQGGVRAQGWVWRTCAMTASTTPDADATMRSQFVTVLNYNASKFRAEYEQGDADNLFGANVLGVPGFGWQDSNIFDTDPNAGWPAWQAAFFTAALGLTWDLQVVTEPKARGDLQWVRDFCYKGFAGLLGRSGVAGEYSFTRAANYQNLKVGQDVGASFLWRTNWGDVWTATWGTANTNPGANTLVGGNIGAGGAGFSTSYWGNIMPAIAYAVDHGALGALDGYMRLRGATNWNENAIEWNQVPVWGIRPRSVSN